MRKDYFGEELSLGDAVILYKNNTIYEGMVAGFTRQWARIIPFHVAASVLARPDSKLLGWCTNVTFDRTVKIPKNKITDTQKIFTMSLKTYFKI